MSRGTEKMVLPFRLGLLVWTVWGVAAEALPVCLLTGFEPFGGAKDNPSWEMLKPLAGQVVAGYRLETLQLPVAYDKLAPPLEAAIARYRPRLVISFGQGGRRIQLERVAHNGYHPAKSPDNLGQRPAREQILPGGAAQLPTQLPAEAILRALHAAGLEAAASDNAGGYLCNECFYRLLALRDQAGAAGIVARGFVHVPRPLPPGQGYTLEDLTRAVKLIVETTIREQEKAAAPIAPPPPHPTPERKGAGRAAPSRRMAA